MAEGAPAQPEHAVGHVFLGQVGESAPRDVFDQLSMPLTTTWRCEVVVMGLEG